LRYDPESSFRTINLLAAALALVVALIGPAVYFFGEYSHQVSALETEVEINARIVDDVIAENPELWRFEEVRLGELLSRRPAEGDPEERRIYDSANGVVAESRQMLAAPLLRRSVKLLDSGKVVGRFEIVQSMRPLLQNTGSVGLLGTLLGLSIFIVLRILPLRALEKALAALDKEKERAQVTLHSIADGVITTNPIGEIESLNAMAESLTGWRKIDARWRSLGEVYRTLDARTRNACPNPVERVLCASGKEEPPDPSNRIVLVSRDGVERLIEESAARIHDHDGNRVGAVLVFRDVTEKVRTEEELLKGKKLESLGILAGGIAHDFNNFLAGILGNISLAKLSVEPGGKASGRLEAAEKAVLRAKELASKLLTFSKGGKPLRKPVLLEEIVRDSAYLAVMGSNCRCEFLLQEGLWPAIADDGQMGQAINNLAINAVQAMPGGGTVRIRMENAAVGNGEILHVKAGDYVKIDVVDHGIGIPGEHLPKIFDPYFTTKEHGCGLGLATTYNILKSHGGNIFAESTPGVGTAFHLYVPAVRGFVLSKGTAEEAAAIRGKGRILVMDDEEMILEVAGGMLRHLGYEPASARNGSEAILAYRTAAEGGNRFDAVVMDLTIPGGMGGEEAAQELLELDPDAKLIVSSGYSNDPVMASYAKYGFRGVVVKPYRIEELSRTLHEVIRGGQECRV